MKKRLKKIIIAVLLFIAFSVVAFRYYYFVTRTIYKESVAHLSEIIHQSNYSLHDFVERNWIGMRTWVDYLGDVADEKEIEKFIQHAKEENGFTDFYFVSRKGNYRTISGTTGYLDLADKLPDLILYGKEMVVNSVVPGQPQIMVFLTPASGTYQGFEYEAIAISFNNSDMEGALKIAAFENSFNSYLIHTDGRVILDSAINKEKEIYNFLAMLEKYSDLSSDEIDELREILKRGTAGAMLLSIDDVRYYLIYESAQFEDWTLVGLVPANIVNASMNKLQYSTILLILGILIVPSLLVIVLVIRQNQIKLKNKDKEIIYRDELFSKLSTHVDDVFMMIDAENKRVDYISPNIDRLMGIPDKKVRQNIHELDLLSMNVDREKDLNVIKNMRPRDQIEGDKEFIHQKSKEVRWFHVVILCSNAENEKKYILVMSDRTKDKKVNQALEDAVKVAETANKAKSTFLSNMSHDIRTPMNAIIGFSTLASANIGNEEKVKDYLAKIMTSGNHLLSLINDVLDMSRIESGKIYLEEKEENLWEILQDIKNIVSVQIHAKQMKLLMDIVDVVDENVYCDKIRLNQVLLNLLSNAIKFTPSGGTVSVRVAQMKKLSEGKGCYEIRVKDTGIGMSKEFVDRIFKPFERERTSTVSKIQGTGLGMSIAKNIIDMMGGTIEVITQHGKGTEFIIRLELRIVPELKKEEKDVRPEGLKALDEDDNFKTSDSVTTPCTKTMLMSDLQKTSMETPGCEKENKDSLQNTLKPDNYIGKKILLVEDNELNSEIAIEILEDYGFEIDLAENGQKAVDFISASKPGDYDLILMDIQMPVMDGMEATRHIRSLPNEKLSNIPIIAMTANAFEEDRQAAFDCGMNGFVSKPIVIEEIFQELQKIWI